ncbi:MAG TPA: hypothetical protein PKI46_02605, partial [Bacteroidales bacterium]|nr:hypothetical protein [Bacteroidales bacterium]
KAERQLKAKADYIKKMKEKNPNYVYHPRITSAEDRKIMEDIKKKEKVLRYISAKEEAAKLKGKKYHYKGKLL